ncbi:MAG: vWA domain-containing protein [Polyangiales bacterium]
MRNWLWIALVGAAGVAAVACGGNGTGDPFNGGTGGTGGTGGVTLNCDTLDPPPADCDKACSSDSQCEASFCENSKCVAYCTATEGCGSGSTCDTRRGRCIPDVGSGGVGGSGNSGGNGCQSVEITPTRSIPNVMFLVDQSGSMDASFGGGENRWEAANTVINGIVSDAESIVRFGLTTYTSRDGDVNPPCPRLPTQIDFALDNASTIGTDSLYPYTYPTDAGEDTPTGDSIDALVGNIQSNPPPAEGPTIIVLATDGAPDSCEYPDPNNSAERDSARGEAVTAAGAAHDAGIDVFVLWVGTLSDSAIEDHLQEVANEGIGLAANGSQGDAPFWVGTNPQQLEDEFVEIINASISCDVQMDERFDDKVKACSEGDVRLNGAPLACSETNGWRVKPGVDDVIELVGAACDTFKSGDVTFSAEFPCGAIVVE